MTIPAPTATTTPAAPKQKSPVGLSALIVGAVAFVFAIVPVLSFIAWLPAIAAIVLGIIGLVQKNRTRGFAWAGIALGVVAWIVAIVVSISSVAGLAGAVSEAVESASAAPVAPSSIAAPAETTEAEPAEASAPAEPAQPPVPTEFISALAQAETYSSIMHMSKAGVFDQLTSEYGGQFTPEAAQYAVDNVKADWNANALESAKTFQDSMSMSPAAIYDQLVSEYGSKFTAEEAQYAVDNLG
ncbi:Ltp family lipoprotein [Microbacterium sp. VKM Ac-2923]|uniref:Ltp family lipoprotein n=1 Tax=Microbacterium sp. VKM Ac-2923 TaxID=2929476 RepID=UPI001FB4BE54|nr:Ltp family lipoprotein [Microbacterium sp. VKM Ac-2923]MCJ1707371.1 Ltp family lipoprotein [Microbacterium sp. VKM Ac-2923]